MNRPRLLISLFLVMSIYARWACGANVLEVVPGDSLGVVVVNNLEMASTRVDTIAKLIGVRAPSLINVLAGRLQVKEGIDRTGSVALAFLPNKDADARPIPVLFAPVSDYATLVRELGGSDPDKEIVDVRIGGSDTVMAKLNEYAVLMPSGERETISHVISATSHLVQPSQPLHEFIRRGQVYLIVSRAGLQLGTAKILEGIGMMKEQFGGLGEQGKQVVAGMVMYEKLFQALGEYGSQIGLVGQIEDDGTVHVATRMVLLESALKNWKIVPPPGELLSGLPAGPFFVAGTGSAPDQDLSHFAQWYADLIKPIYEDYGFTPEQTERLVDLSVKSMQGFRSFSMMMGVGKPTAESLYEPLKGVIHVDDSQEFLRGYRATMQEMKKLMDEIENPMFKYSELKTVSVDGTEVLKFTMQFDMAAIPGADNPQATMMLEKMFGPEGKISVFVAPVGKNQIAVAYVSLEELKVLMKAAQNPQAGLAQDADIRRIAALLPEKSQWVGFFSPQGAEAFARNMATLFGGEEQAKMIPKFPPSLPIGFAVKQVADGFETDAVVPAATLKAGGEFAKKVQETFQQGL